MPKLLQGNSVESLMRVVDGVWASVWLRRYSNARSWIWIASFLDSA